MCATQIDLGQRALYGPTGCMEWFGPVGKGTLQAFAFEESVMERLWVPSEKRNQVKLKSKLSDGF
jgi:hypothetical protein